MKKSLLLISLGFLCAGCFWFPEQEPSDPNAPQPVFLPEDRPMIPTELPSEEQNDQSSSTMPQASPSSSADNESSATEEPTASAGAYVAYSDGVPENGETKLLFFHAPWCPFCVANDKVLSALYDANELSRSTYKIDYDSATALRSRYGVVTQDTVVLVDGNGEAITSIFHPSESDFLTMLK